MKRLVIDPVLLLCSLALIIIGVLFIYSAGVDAQGIQQTNEYQKQIIFALSGFVILMLSSMIDHRLLRDYAYVFYGIIVIMLIAVKGIAAVTNGAQSWFGFGPVKLQPSEFMKIAAILAAAKYLKQNEKKSRELLNFAIPGILTVIPLFLILIQPDLGTAIVFYPIFAFMMYIYGTKTRYIIFSLIVIGVMIVFSILPRFNEMILSEPSPFLDIFIRPDLLVWTFVFGIFLTALTIAGYFVTKKASSSGGIMANRIFYWVSFTFSAILLGALLGLAGRRVLHDYQINRLLIFLNPYIDPQNDGWHIIQSLTAVGSGGLTGKGFLLGTQSHLQYLPEQSTDFIFSILSEEWGFIGGITVFALYVIIWARGLYLVYKAKNTYSSYIGAGVIGMLFFHFMQNIGMAIGVMPITGIPLFFLSYGGSSLWTVMIGLGLLMSLNRGKRT